MMDMGAEPFLVAASVRAVLAQRLVRKVCPFCSELQTITKSELSMLGLCEDKKFKIKRGKGCDKCTNGYKAQKILHMSSPFRVPDARPTPAGHPQGD